MSTFRKFSAVAGGMALVVCSQASLAQAAGSLTYSGAAQAVPTIGGAALLLLSALLGVVAVRYGKAASKGGVTALLLGALALASAGSGVQLISSAEAIAFDSAELSLDKEAGGTVSFEEGNNLFTNTTGITLKIESITLLPLCSIEDGLNGGGTTCAVGQELTAGASCTVFVNCSNDNT